MPRKNDVSGTFIVLENGQHIKVSTRKIQASNIQPRPDIRSGILTSAGFEQVYPASLPVFREDIALRLLEEAGMKVKDEKGEYDFGLLVYLGLITVCDGCGKPFNDLKPVATKDGKGQLDLCPVCFEINEGQFDAQKRAKEVYSEQMPAVPETLKMLFPEGEAVKKFMGLSMAIARGLETFPLKTYRRASCNTSGEVLSEDLVKQYRFLVDEKTGQERFEQFPYLEKTHFLPMRRETVWPRIHYDQFLMESLYELYAEDDATRFALFDIARKLDAWSFPDGHEEEGMIVVEGYHATSGTTREYAALIVPEYILQEDGSKKFVLVMKLSESNIQYGYAMPEPKPGEVPKTTAPQKPIVMKSFNQLLTQVAKTK